MKSTLAFIDSQCKDIRTGDMNEENQKRKMSLLKIYNLFIVKEMYDGVLLNVSVNGA